MVNTSIKCPNSTLYMTISSISHMKEISSPVVFIQGSLWKVEASKDEDDDSLAVGLYCTKEDDPSNWVVSACATIKLMPFSDDINAHVRHITPNVFSSAHSSFGLGRLISQNFKSNCNSSLNQICVDWTILLFSIKNHTFRNCLIMINC